MEHTQIVTAGQLDNYGGTRESEDVIPEVLYLLVRESISELSICRIPYGDAINQPGLDGIVQSETAFREFVPQGTSYWEINTGDNPQKAATTNFTKRTKSVSLAERAKSTFVFATPRAGTSGIWTEPQQTKWRKARESKGWKGVRIIDGVKLADWLREFPGIGRWLWKKMGLSKTLGGFTTPAEHWENLQTHVQPGDPALPAKAFLIGREGACSNLKRLFDGESKRMLLFAESEQDVEDFVAAYFASLDDEIARSQSLRCLFVKDADAWHSIANLKPPHVLVAHPSLSLESEGESLDLMATKRGHSVVIPICGAWSGGNREIIKLRSPSEPVLEQCLTENGYSLPRARELAVAGASSLAALKRHLRGLSGLPPYATWEHARVLAQAGLVGKWEGKNPADQAAIELLLGKSYGEWIEILRNEALRSDTPLIQHNDRWKMLPRGEAWIALGPRLSDDDLERLKQCAAKVLGELDPKFELPKEERFAASIHGKNLLHSNTLREGLAETLALLGSRPQAMTNCSLSKPEAVTVLTVRHLLEKADWQKWASLDHLLPLLAEAAPDEFLDCLEAALENPEKSPFQQVFAEEGSGGIGGWNYTTGLLWGLETLSWSADYLARATLILGDLAAIDPGGNWANRPANSLTNIYLPWHLQTCASFAKRKAAVEILLKEQPSVGWTFILALLPNNHGFTMGSHRPSWRNFIASDWKETVTNKEYWEQITAYTELAIRMAKSDIAKLAVLIGRLPDLPRPAHDGILAHLRSSAILDLPESARLPLWNALVDLVRHHRKFFDSNWAMSRDVVDNIEVAANELLPSSPEIRHQRLFSGREYDLYDEKGNFEDQRKKLELLRQQALQEIWELGGTSAILDFAQRVSSSQAVGLSFANIATDIVDEDLLPEFLLDEKSPLASFIGGFVWGRYWSKKWEWVDKVLSGEWELNLKAALLVLLPFVEETWDRVTSHLGANEALYWKKAIVNPWHPYDCLSRAVSKLLEYERPDAAVQCLSMLIEGNSTFLPDLAVRALSELLKVDPTGITIDQHAIVKVIEWLQECPTADPNEVFRIEWHYLPLLGRYSGGSPKTLERRLAEDPSFYCEVIRAVFRSRKEEKKSDEPSENQRNLARNAFRLLDEWRLVPGTKSDSVFDKEAFVKWLAEMKALTSESGHLQVALSRLGQVLVYAPTDPTGLWIHCSVAEALNAKDAKEMRSGFTCKLFNERGVHGFTAGKEEREIAQIQRERAEILEASGYSRFATAMREFAVQYERVAESEAARDPFED